MAPREVLEKWLQLFNEANAEEIAELYAENATNHQVANDPVVGKTAIKEMFIREFANADMVCIPENIFSDGEWVILEWKDPKEMRGCGFFHIQNDLIVFQRGYWDKLSFHRLYDIPLK
ncbi:MAG: nuclear transport factor 2 family protein [Bacteroidota bacterium]